MQHRTIENTKQTRYRKRSQYIDMPILEMLKANVPIPIPEVNADIAGTLIKLRENFSFTDSDVRSLGYQARKHGYKAFDYIYAYGTLVDLALAGKLPDNPPKYFTTVLQDAARKRRQHEEE